MPPVLSIKTAVAKPIHRKPTDVGSRPQSKGWFAPGPPTGPAVIPPPSTEAGDGTMRFPAMAMTMAAVAVGLGGCGLAAKVNARSEMTQSESAYKACLVQHPGQVSACESVRLAYEADLQMYRATSAGVQPGRSDTVNVISGR